jgi:hypothetical protein
VKQLGQEVELRLSYPLTTTSGLTLTGIDGIEIFRMEMPIGAPALPFGATEPGAEDEDTGLAAPEEELPTEDVAGPEADIDPEEDAATELDSAEIDPEASDPEASDQPEAPQDENLEPQRDPIRPVLFAQLVKIEAVVEAAELLAATSGDQIALRLPLAPVPAEEPTLFAYGVRTIGLNGLRSPYSNIAELEPKDPPAPPSSLTVEAQKDGIVISWSSQEEGIAGFAVYRRQSDVRIYGEPLERLGTDVQSFLDTAALYDMSYFYTVRARSAENDIVESGLSGEAQIDYRDVFPPDPPVNVEVLPESGQIRLLWDASEVSDVAGYIVYRQDPGQEYRRVSDDLVARQEYLDRGLAAGLTYLYQVTAIDTAGNESERSEEVPAVPTG